MPFFDFSVSQSLYLARFCVLGSSDCTFHRVFDIKCCLKFRRIFKSNCLTTLSILPSLVGNLLLSHWTVPSLLEFQRLTYFFIGPYLQFLNLKSKFTFSLEYTFISWILRTELLSHRSIPSFLRFLRIGLLSHWSVPSFLCLYCSTSQPPLQLAICENSINIFYTNRRKWLLSTNKCLHAGKNVI